MLSALLVFLRTSVWVSWPSCRCGGQPTPLRWRSGCLRRTLHVRRVLSVPSRSGLVVGPAESCTRCFCGRCGGENPSENTLFSHSIQKQCHRGNLFPKGFSCSQDLCRWEQVPASSVNPNVFWCFTKTSSRPWTTHVGCGRVLTWVSEPYWFQSLFRSHLLSNLGQDACLL